MKTILITGAAGFVGRALCKQLAAHYKVIGLYHKQKPFDLTKDKPIPSKKIPTACIAFRKTHLRFDEKFIGSGFEDDDFSAAHYSAQGAYMRIRAKFDKQSVKDAAKWINR